MKKIFLFILLTLLLCTGALAYSSMCFPPHTVIGKLEIFGGLYSDVELEFTKSSRNYFGTIEEETLMLRTNEHGEFNVDLVNLKSCYNFGDKITIKIQDCVQSDACETEFMVTDNGGPAQLFDFIVLDIDNPESTILTETEIKEIIIEKEDKELKNRNVILESKNKVLEEQNSKLIGELKDKVIEKDEEEKKSVKDQIVDNPIISGVLAAILLLIADILARFKWGKGFAGMIKYYAKTDPKRGAKMAKTVAKNYAAGKYKKKKK